MLMYYNSYSVTTPILVMLKICGLYVIIIIIPKHVEAYLAS